MDFGDEYRYTYAEPALRRHSYIGLISPQDFEDKYYEKVYEKAA
jgi:hypothetical protein